MTEVRMKNFLECTFILMGWDHGQARNQDFSRGGGKKVVAGENFFFFFKAMLGFTVVYGFLYYIVNVRYKD